MLVNIHAMLFPAPSVTQADKLLHNQRFATFREIHYAITILLEKNNREQD